MKANVVAGCMTFVIMIMVSVFVVYPNLFGFIKGLFENQDIGTLVGLVACFCVTGLLFGFSAVVSAAVAAFVGD